MDDHHRPRERPWLMHLDDEVRLRALRMVEETHAAVLRDAARPGTSTVRTEDSLRLRAAVDVEGRRRGVRFSMSGRLCSLIAPTGDVAERRRLTIDAPPPIIEGLDGIHDRAAAVLASWRDQFARTPSAAELEAAAQVRAALATVARGAVEAFGTDWRSLTLLTFPAGHYLLYVVQAEDGRGPLRFTSDADREGLGRMSPELVEALEAFWRGRLHAGEMLSRDGDEMPCIVVDAPPPQTLRNDGDPVAKLRAMAALPPGAELIAAAPS